MTWAHMLALSDTALTGIIGSAVAALGLLLGYLEHTRQGAKARRGVNEVLGAADDDEAMGLAHQNADNRTSVVLAVLDRQMRKNVDCEVKLAQEKRERKADVKRLEARLEALTRERQ